MSSSVPDLGVLGETAVFFAASDALEAIDVDAIMQRADEDGVVHTQILLGDVGPDGSRMQVTCRVEMSLRLLCAWIEATKDESAVEASLLETLRSAAAAAQAAFEDARRTRKMGCF